VNPQAEQLNNILMQQNASLFELLSEKGKRIYFPHSGILGQSAAAKGKKFNATIGIACEDDLSPMRLDVLDDQISLDPSKVFPYSPSFGNPELRKVWRDMIVRKNPRLADASFSLPVVTHALTHGLFVAGQLFLNPGEEILVPAPYWDNYDLLFEESLGATVTTYECFTKDNTLNTDGLARVLEKRKGGKAVLLLNFPNNPTGYTPLETEMDQLAEVLKAAADAGTKLVVILDDAYFGLVYESGVAKESLFGSLAGSHRNIVAIKLDGATKEDYAWGFRVGFITFANKDLEEDGYKALTDKSGGVVRSMISNCCQLSQSLLLATYVSDDYQKQKEDKYNILCNRYNVIKNEFAQRKEFAEVFAPLPYNSGYFMCIQPVDGIDANEVSKILLSEFDTGVIVLQGLIRIAYSSVPASNIPTLLDNIYQACLKLKD
jgi:aspartate/methionine/tyrosine aminotransferase